MSATSQMLSDQAFALAEYGREIVVITSRHGYSDRTERYPAREKIDGVTVHRVPTSSFGRFRLFGRALDCASFLLTSGWHLLVLVRPGDIVVAKTDPPMLSALVYPICALRGAKLVNWLQDLFPEAASVLKVGRSWASKLAFAVLGRLRNRSLCWARANVVIGNHMARRVEQLGVDPMCIVTIPNWANGKLVYPVPHQVNSLRHEWNLQDRFVVAYSGNLGRAHDYQTILEAIGIVERERLSAAAFTNEQDQSYLTSDSTALATNPVEGKTRKPILWLFIGSGANYSKLQQEVVKHKLTSVVFRGYQPRECLAESLSCADVHLATLRPEMEGLSVPSKVYGSLASGRPVVFIGDRGGDTAGMLRRHNCGISIDQGDGAGLARALIELAENTALTNEMGRKSRQVLDKHFELRHAVARWQTLLNKVAAEP